MAIFGPTVEVNPPKRTQRMGRILETVQVHVPEEMSQNERDQLFFQSGVGAERWKMGVEWRPDGLCLPAWSWGDYCQTEEDVKDEGRIDTNAIGTAYPITVGGSYTCSTFSGETLDERVAHAWRAMELGQNWQIERELWSGAIATQQGTGNFFLTNGDAEDLTGDGVDPLTWTTALARLQSELVTCLGDATGVIHMSAYAFSLYTVSGQVYKDPETGVFRDCFGNVVVAGAGYEPDNEPEFSTLYGTGPIVVLLGVPQVVGSNETVATDRQVNDVTVRVEREASVVVDDCCVLSVDADFEWPVPAT